VDDAPGFVHGDAVASRGVNQSLDVSPGRPVPEAAFVLEQQVAAVAQSRRMDEMKRHRGPPRFLTAQPRPAERLLYMHKYHAQNNPDQNN
jgi:hypothetical protein